MLCLLYIYATCSEIIVYQTLSEWQAKMPWYTDYIGNLYGFSPLCCIMLAAVTFLCTYPFRLVGNSVCCIAYYQPYRRYCIFQKFHNRYGDFQKIRNKSTINQSGHSRMSVFSAITQKSGQHFCRPHFSPINRNIYLTYMN